MIGSRLLTLAGFAAAVGLIVAAQWAARRPDSRIPTLGEVCARLMRYEYRRVPVGRIAVLGFWWWVGWHFLAR